MVIKSAENGKKFQNFILKIFTLVLYNLYLFVLIFGVEFV